MKLHIKVHMAGGMTFTSSWRVGKISEGTFYLFICPSFIITSFNQAVHKLRTTSFGCFFVRTNTKYTESLAIGYASFSMVRMTTSRQ